MLLDENIPGERRFAASWRGDNAPSGGYLRGGF